MKCARHVAHKENTDIHTNCWLEDMKGRNNLEDLGMKERLIWILEKSGEYVVWIPLAKDRGQCWVLVPVKTIMNFQVTQKVQNAFISSATTFSTRPLFYGAIRTCVFHYDSASDQIPYSHLYGKNMCHHSYGNFC
jgi:hypothetical protein